MRFASVELLRYPQLQGLPVVIGDRRRKVDDALLAMQGERALRFIPLADFPRLKDDAGKTVGIKLRYDDFKIATRDQTAAFYTADGNTIRKMAGQCLKRVPLDKRLRLLGVRAATLARAGEEPVHEQKMATAQSERAQAAIDSIANTDQLF